MYDSYGWYRATVLLKLPGAPPESELLTSIDLFAMLREFAGAEVLSFSVFWSRYWKRAPFLHLRSRDQLSASARLAVPRIDLENMSRMSEKLPEEVNTR